MPKINSTPLFIINPCCSALAVNGVQNSAVSEIVIITNRVKLAIKRHGHLAIGTVRRVVSLEPVRITAELMSLSGFIILLVTDCASGFISIWIGSQFNFKYFHFIHSHNVGGERAAELPHKFVQHFTQSRAISTVCSTAWFADRF